MFLKNSIKISCKNLYYNPKPFRIIFKSNSYLMSVSHRGPVNPSASTFPNINITKTIKNLLVISKIIKKWLKNSLFPSSNLWYEFQIIFLSDVTLPWRHGKSVNPNFRQCQFDRHNDKLNCCLGSQSKIVARISIYTLSSLKLFSNQIHIWCQFPVVTQ